jgi:hydrocephalus-inducing protein
MTIVHHDHPHRETVDLVGEVCFPNIKLGSDMINFGSILNDTTKKIMINMQNISEMALNYEWTFVEEEVVGVGTGTINSSNSIGGGAIPINEIFDILPLSGYLEPGQVEEVEFVYNALGGMNFRATAVCHIEGGPNYEVKL